MPAKQKESVVLVHGIWMIGLDMFLLRWRLQDAGYDVYQFSYASLTQSPPENAADLKVFLQDVPGETVHFVCHSLGGLVVRHLLHDYPGQRPGRVVTLGTPHQPSAAARQLEKSAPGRLLLGQSVENGLLGEIPSWPPGRELGSIAGDLPLGVGLLIPGIPSPSDGTVAVAETRLDGMRDHVVVHTSHFGLLFSKQAAEQVIRFLETGSFSEDSGKN